MMDFIYSVKLIDLLLLEGGFNMVDIEAASKGGAMSIDLSANVTESVEDNILKFDISLNLSGYPGPVENKEDLLFNLHQKYVAIFEKENIDFLEKMGPDVVTQYCLTLVYPYIRESAQGVFRNGGLGDMGFPLQFTPDM